MRADDSTPGSPPSSTEKGQSAGKPRPIPEIPDHQLLRCIGRGSYGEVWLAQNMMEEYRAVKIVYRASFQERRPFDRELSGIRKFEPISRSHDGFIDILHVGINEEAGYFYYVMEAGDDLRSGPNIDPHDYSPKTLGKYVSLHGALSLQESIQLGLALSLALSELHKRGLVHRDVKPSNIIFVNGIPKLADIGLVADANEARSYVGTEGFIPPEGPGAAQADIFSLGKTLYEVSTGKDRHDFPELPTSVGEFPDLSGFLELNEVLMHACQNDPKARYQSAWNMHTDLVVLTAGKSVKRLKVLERRLANLKRIGGASALVLLVLVGVGYEAYREWQMTIASRERHVGADIANGNYAMQSGNLLTSLPYFTDALRMDAENPGQAITHRLRIGSVLVQCPKLTHLWSDGIQVNEVEFSPDDKQVLVAEFQGRVKIYDLASDKVRSRVFGTNDWLWSAQLSPDGRFIATANGDGSAYVLDSSDLQEVRRLPHPRAVTSVRFSPDGRRIVTACRDGITRVWNPDSKTIELNLQRDGDLKAVSFADFSPDNLLIVAASEGNVVCIWDAKSGSLRREFPHPGWVYYAAFSPDNKRVVTACSDHRARVWDIQSGQQLLPDLIHGDGVKSAEFSPDGRFIVTASLDGTARLWDAESLQPMACNPVINHGERLIHAGFSHDGRQVITSGADGTIRVWDFAGTATPPRPVPYGISEDGNRFCSVTNDTVEIRDFASDKPTGPLIHSSPHPVKATLSRDGHFVAIVTRSLQTEENHIQIWDVTSGAKVGPPCTVSHEASNVVLSVDGTRLLTFGGPIAQSWDVRRGTALSGPLEHTDSVACAFFSPSAAQFATISGPEVTIRDTSTGRPCFAPLTFLQPVHAAAFSRDGSKIVGCCWDYQFTKCYAQIWNATNGRPVGPRLMHGDGVLGAAFSPDGKRVVTASEDFTATVWDAMTGQRLITPVEHGKQVRTASFSPDGKWFVTASTDGTARVWNAETGDPLTPPLWHFGKLNDAAFLADGRHIATHDEKEECRIWTLAFNDWPVDDLIILSRLLSSQSGTRFGASAANGSDSLEATWKRLRIKYPSAFATSGEEIARWHEFQAQKCHIHKQWFAETFHLKRLLMLRPGDQSVMGEIDSVNEHLTTEK
jgi:WD40 repeat protein